MIGKSENHYFLQYWKNKIKSKISPRERKMTMRGVLDGVDQK